MPRPLVERLNVFQDVFKAVGARWDQTTGKSVKHKRVIGVRRMTQVQQFRLHERSLRWMSRKYRGAGGGPIAFTTFEED